MKIRAMLKKLVDSDTQVLYKAKYLDEELNLTNEGKDTLLSLILADYKQKLVENAKEDLEAEKEEREVKIVK